MTTEQLRYFTFLNKSAIFFKTFMSVIVRQDDEEFVNKTISFSILLTWRLDAGLDANVILWCAHDSFFFLIFCLQINLQNALTPIMIKNMPKKLNPFPNFFLHFFYKKRFRFYFNLHHLTSNISPPPLVQK